MVQSTQLYAAPRRWSIGAAARGCARAGGCVGLGRRGLMHRPLHRHTFAVELENVEEDDDEVTQPAQERVASPP